MALITETEHASVSAAALAGLQGASQRYSVIDPGARVGSGTSIGAHVRIEAAAVVGDDCVLESGVHVCSGTVIERRVHIGANVAFATAPRGAATPATVRQGAWIGANASVAAGVVIGSNAVVRPGSAVARSVPPNAIVEGNPAAIVGYVDTQQGPATALKHAPRADAARVEPTGVRDVSLHHFPIIRDLRGDLTVGNFEREVPFIPLRYFVVFGVPNREVRGEHAHHECCEFLICLRGSCSVVVDDGRNKVEVELDSPDRGLYLPAMTWRTQYKYSADAMLLAFASHYYDSADYIREYADFIAATAGRAAA